MRKKDEKYIKTDIPYFVYPFSASSTVVFTVTDLMEQTSI